MQVLKILSDIWKLGADIYLDEADDRISIKYQELIPAEVMKAAEENFQAIDEWFKSWKGATGEKITVRKMVHHMCGWQNNKQLDDWLCSNDETLMMLEDWMVMLAKNGWKDIYEDYRQYENDESNALAHELYVRAVTHAKKGA